MRPYQIVLADDHLMLRHGIKRIIEESEDLKSNLIDFIDRIGISTYLQLGNFHNCHWTTF